MAKNIVICSDGTGNAFAERVSNITLLVKSLELKDPHTQIVFYDQGLGTDPKLVEAVTEYKFEPGENRVGLHILAAPQLLRWVPHPVTRFAGLTVGYGLRKNVEEMYKALVENYNDGDQIFLFGFSRGAFTVRVLAGLIYRCGLLPDVDDFDKRFSQAYRLYKPHELHIRSTGHHSWSDFLSTLRLRKPRACHDVRVQKFKEAHRVRPCEIAFLGIWDTVKSYGGIWPQSLPHLRFNPIVKSVSHALALDEHRAWFVPTSWGWIDADEHLIDTVCPDERYKTQEIQEVWFRGYHSDIGGADKAEATARISLRWMLKYASAKGLLLNQKGKDALLPSRLTVPPETHESFTKGWDYVERIFPRWELDNSKRPPKRRFRWGHSGNRDIQMFQRDSKVYVHWSAGKIEAGKAEIVIVRDDTN